MDRWRASIEIPADVHAPEAARNIVAALLPAWDLGDLISDAQLIASELVTNAYRHAQGTAGFELLLVQRDAGVRIALADGSSIKPVIAELSHERPSGRGMMLVSALCTEWGSESRDGGKQVWADLDRT